MTEKQDTHVLPTNELPKELEQRFDELFFDESIKINNAWKKIIDSGGEYLAKKHADTPPDEDYWEIYRDDLIEIKQFLAQELAVAKEEGAEEIGVDVEKLRIKDEE